LMRYSGMMLCRRSLSMIKVLIQKVRNIWPTLIVLPFYVILFR